MTALCIVLGILALVFLLLMTRCDLHLVYKDTFAATLHILCFRRTLYPKKKEKVKLRDHSRRAAKKKKIKKRQAASKPTQKPAEKPKNETGTLAFLKKILTELLKNTFGYVKLRATRLVIKVGSSDPATTAILFGAVNTAVIGVMEVLDQFGKLKTARFAVLSVSPDFLAEKTETDIQLVFSLRVWHMLAILFRSFLSYLKKQNTENKA